MTAHDPADRTTVSVKLPVMARLEDRKLALIAKRRRNTVTWSDTIEDLLNIADRADEARKAARP